MSTYSSKELELIKNKNGIINKMCRLVKLNEKTAVWNSSTKSYTQVLKQGEIVSCEFIGIEKELDDTHFAIVWIVDPTRDSVGIIPITSKDKGNYKNFFSIGIIDNFITSSSSTDIKESFVKLECFQFVSRVRLKSWYQKDASRNNIVDKKNNPIPVSISQSAINRISDGLKAVFLNETCLKDIIQNQIKKQMPIALSDHDKEYLNRPICLKDNCVDTSNPSEYKIIYKGYSEDSYSTISCFYVKELRTRDRNMLIKDLLSCDSIKHLNAQSSIEQYYNQYKNPSS